MSGAVKRSERGRGRRRLPPVVAPGGSAWLAAVAVTAVSLWASCQGVTKSVPGSAGQGGAGGAIGGGGGSPDEGGQGGAGGAVGGGPDAGGPGGGGGLPGAGGFGGVMACPRDPSRQNVGGASEPTIRLGQGGAGGEPISGGTGGVPTFTVPRDVLCGPGEATSFRCASDQVCEPPRCQDSCRPGRTACAFGGAAACTDLETDKVNCGACGHRCPDDRQTCQAGVCTCPAGFESCDGFCVDLRSNPQNCGACGASCDLSREICSGGACTCSASLGFGVYDCGVDVIALTSGLGGDSVGGAAIGRSGAVAYVHARPDVSTVFVSSDDGVAGIVGVDIPRYHAPISSLSVNAGGEVAFIYPYVKQVLYETEMVSDLYASDGQRLTPIFLQTSNEFLREARGISDSGQVVFKVMGYDAVDPSRRPETIVISDGMVATPIASTDGGEFTDIYHLDANNAGDVAFVARRTVGQVLSLFIATSSGTTEIPLEGFQGDREDLITPFINDKGSVVILWDSRLIFVDRTGRRALLEPAGDVDLAGIDDADTVAFFDHSGHLVLRSPDGVQRTVVATGDRLFGSVVSQLNSTSFRGNGQLALGIELADGRSAIVRICVSAPTP